MFYIHLLLLFFAVNEFLIYCEVIIVSLIPILQESMRENYIKNVKKTIQTFSDYLGSKEWLMGSEVDRRK